MPEEKHPGQIQIQVNYEFTPHQNESLNRLTDAMEILWLGMFFGGIVQSIFGFFMARWLNQHPLDAPPVWYTLVTLSCFSGFILVICAAILRRSRAAFVQIVLTEGTDIDHLMEALNKLANFFFTSLMLAWLLIFGIFVALIRVRASMMS